MTRVNLKSLAVPVARPCPRRRMLCQAACILAAAPVHGASQGSPADPTARTTGLTVRDGWILRRADR